MEKVSAQLVTIMEDHLRVGGFNTMGVLCTYPRERSERAILSRFEYKSWDSDSRGIKVSPNTTIHPVFEQKFAMSTMPACS